MAANDAPTPPPTGNEATMNAANKVTADGVTVTVTDGSPQSIKDAFTAADGQLASGTSPCPIYKAILDQQLTASMWGPSTLPAPVFEHLWSLLTPTQETAIAGCGITQNFVFCQDHTIDQGVDGCIPNPKCTCAATCSVNTQFPKGGSWQTETPDNVFSDGDNGVTGDDVGEATWSECNTADCCDCFYCNSMVRFDGLDLPGLGLGESTPAPVAASSRRRAGDKKKPAPKAPEIEDVAAEGKRFVDAVTQEMKNVMSKDFDNDGTLSKSEYEAYFVGSQTIAHYFDSIYSSVPIPGAYNQDTQGTNYNMMLFVGGWSAILTVVMCLLARKLAALNTALK